MSHLVMTRNEPYRLVLKCVLLLCSADQRLLLAGLSDTAVIDLFHIQHVSVRSASHSVIA